MANNIRKLLFLTVFLIVIVVCLSIFLTQKTYPVNQTSPAIVNSYILYDTLPEEVVDYTVSRVEQWSDITNDDNKPNYVISDAGVAATNGEYVFYLEKDSKDEPVVVSVTVQNLGNFYSTSVKINGEIQRID